MAINAPMVRGPDGVLREETLFSTTVATRFFTGTVDEATVDMEVSIRGGGFTNDPDLISFEGTEWVIPNPAAFPDGLDLVAGNNNIQIRSVASSGAVSAPAVVDVRLLTDGDLGVVAEVPTDIRVERFDASVEISVRGIEDTRITGYNFYASQFAGGGATGYQRINLSIVDEGEVFEETNTIQDELITYDVDLGVNGSPAANPQYIKVVGSQVNQNDDLLIEDFTTTVAINQEARRINTTIQVDEVQDVTRFSFQHSRAGTPNSTPPTISIGAFAALAQTEPLYYVVKAVYFDSEQLLEFESSFSQEVVGYPLKIRAAVGNFPVVTRQQLTRDYIQAVRRSRPEVRVEVGSVLRDTVIDPFSSEAERIRFIVDFMHRAQSFASLVQVDDPAGTGESSAVSTNSYKQALKQAFGLTRDADVQAVIDRAFEQLASNVGKFREPGKFARGEVTFFTTTQPQRTISIPLGTIVSAGQVRFRTTRAVEIPFERLASFRDPVTGRYLVRAPVRAEETGTAGNVGRGQVRRVLSTVPGISVTNESRMFGGLSIETNQQLAERAQNALASVDSGTERGYLQTVAAVPGIVQANVVAAGDPLMQRDFDPSDGRHKLGKVDIWIQGNNVATVSDTFAFTFDVANDIQFVLISDPSDLEFRAVDPELSEERPLVEMLDFPAAELGFVNATTGQDFDLTNVEITGFDTIKLDTSISQPAVDLTDVVLGDYRRRTTNEFVLPRQPVRQVTSVAGSVSGSLPGSAFQLNRASDPLANGRSALAGSFVTIIGTTVDGVDVPSGDFITVTDESHVMTGFFPEFLDNLGANVFTIVVTNLDGTVTYKGPNDPSGTSDYTIIFGDETTPLAIQRTDTSAISSGQTVLISYEHDENFTVTYETNLVVDVAQEEVDAMKHVTADVLVKDGVEVPVDIAASVITVRGTVQSDVDQALNTNLSNFFNSLRLGDPVRQSDINTIIESTTGVSYHVVPLTKLVRQQGSQVVREALVSAQSGDAVFLSALSSPTVSVWLLDDRLSAATTNGGGPENDFRGVFEDDYTLTLQEGSFLTTIGVGTGRAAIIGNSGIVIDGYSDDTTLEAEGFTTAAEKVAERANRTGDRILVSTATDDSPVNHSYAVTYIVADETAAKNIEPSDAEYLVLGNLDFTFDEDQG